MGDRTQGARDALGDAWIAFRHAFEVRNPGRRCLQGDFENGSPSCTPCMRRRFPLRMAADMLIAPLCVALLIRRLVRRVPRQAASPFCLHETGEGACTAGGFLRACGLRVGRLGRAPAPWTTRSPASSTSS